MLFGSSVSRIERHVAMNSATPTRHMKIKLACQLLNRSNCAPKIGASIGVTPITNINMDKALAASRVSKLSRITALVITIPAAPPNACNIRHPVKWWISVLRAHPNEAIVNNAKPNKEAFSCKTIRYRAVDKLSTQPQQITG